MRVFISVDLEGIAGIATLDQVVRGGSGYPRAQHLMTAETNAAVAGAFEGGATEVLVNDSHGTKDNLLHTDLDPRARLVFGTPRAQCMAHGLERDTDVALFVGYHAAAGEEGVLAHTFSSSFTELRLNGSPVSEADVNALYAASLGVPVGLVTGDDLICRAVEKSIPGTATAAVKKAEGFAATNTLHPQAAAALVREAAAEAVAGAGRLERLALPDGFVLEVDLVTPLAADYASMLPGTRRSGGRTVQLELGTVEDVLKAISVWYSLAVIPAQQFAALALRT